MNKWIFPSSNHKCSFSLEYFLCLSPPVITSLINTGYFYRLYISLIPLPPLLPFPCFPLLFLLHLSSHSSLFLSSLNHDIGSMVSVSHPVVSGSLRPHGLCPTRFLCPWDSLDKNTRVGCVSSSG